MSFILDALKKSETERQRADTPALYEMKVAPARRGVAVWLIVLGALLVINVVVLSVVLLRGTRSAAPQIDANTAGTAEPAPTATAPPTPAPASAAPSAAAPPSGATTTAQAPDNAAPGTPAPAADDDAPAVERPASGAAVADLPTYEQAASAPGADLPELRLDLHAYASSPADRFVLLNMLNLKEGQSSPAGVRVESITPDGAILSWRGAKFFLHSQ